MKMRGKHRRPSSDVGRCKSASRDDGSSNYENVRTRFTFEKAFIRRSTLAMTMMVTIGLLLFLVAASEADPSAAAVVAATSGPVSFFGSSHVSVRLQEARSTSDIFFRLRTRRADSMLFLAAGRTDYCLLVLDAGRLKVHINLGAGETEIASEAPFLLNDMNWHTVNLTRRGSQLSLLVDNHLTKGTLPSRFHELNIHFGIWLGGLDGFNEIFLGNLPSFRGCMSHITYNQEDVLARAKTHLGQVQGMTWNCSEEFDAATRDAYSLTVPSSYAISRVAISRQGTVVKMSIRPFPTDSDGLIFYVSGVSSRPDYIALELRQGIVRFVAEMGAGPIQLQSNTNISDNQWHPVMIQVSPYSLSLMVDNQSWISETGGMMTGSSVGRVGSRHLDVSEMVYLGLEESKRVKVRSQGLIDRSFRGCIRELTIDDKIYGLPEADVTNNVTTGCAGCSRTNSSVCAPNYNTSSSSSSSFPPSRTSTNGSSSSLEVITISRDLIRIVTMTDVGELEIMRVVPVQVAEGDSVIVSPRHLAVTLDLGKFGIRESGVMFRINKPPQQGRVEVTRTSATSSSSQQGRSSETFSLLDMGAGRVRYWHSGAEGSKDAIELSLRLVETSGFLLPSYLRDERMVTLPIEITAVNDPPEIRLVPGGVLRLAEGTKIRLSVDVITALDPDTGPDDLHFSLLPMGTGGERKGYLELSSEPGKSIRNFTQADLIANLVWYVDQGQSSSKLAFKVTDGSSVSSVMVLRVETFPLRIAPEINSGLEVANVMGSSTPITSANLSFTSNAGDQGLVVEYHVINSPKAGSLQLKRTNGQWTATEQFTQLDLQAGRLRYLLQRPSELATEDEFMFHVSLAETKVPSEFRFRLKILSLRLEQLGPSILHLNGTTQGPLSLKFKTFPLSIPDNSIHYLMVQPPRFGYLTTLQSQSSSAVNVNLGKTYGFSQEDIATNKVIYSFKMTPFSPINDYFLFNVTTSHLDVTLTSGPFRCDVHHTTRKKPASVVLKPLIVVEGGREVISSKILRVRATVGSESGEGQFLWYNVTSGPSHGRLEKERESMSRLMTTTTNGFQNVDKFTSQDLERGRLTYVHDGSETPRDKIEMVAWNADLNFMFGFQLDVIVKGVNNHAPQKAPSASLSLSVVAGGRRQLSPHVLDYIDGDWDADRAALKYTMKGNPSGGVGGREGIGNVYDQSKSSTRPIFQWTQADIDTGKLIFKHEGQETQGNLQFWVTDGKFIINGTLVINAGSPWIRVVNMTTLIAKKGSFAVFNEHSIKVDTNLDVDSSNVKIRILDGPHHGVIKNNGTRVTELTLGEMSVGNIVYENSAVGDVAGDGFGFDAWVAGSGTSSGLSHFDISIYPEAYWTPLMVGANSSVTVHENSSAVISQTALHIINPHIPPSDIVYTLSTPPSHGYLTIDSSHSNEEPDDYVSIWDQTLINDGRLRYVQSEPNKTHDSMYFHVTNGVQTLRDLRLDFMVIPSSVVMVSSSVIITEGSSSILNLTHLHASQSYYADKLTEVKIVSPPTHGIVGLLPRATVQVQNFPFKAVQEGKVIYTHDGSETAEDSFTVVVTAQLLEDSGLPTRKLSVPHSIPILILSTNDQIPVVVNNTGTWVWMGGSTPITNQHLAAVDGDSDADHLVFYVVGSRGGFPALKDRPEEPMANFTQAQINHSLVVFTHKGQDMKPASFEFEVSDGLNEAGKETAKVTVRKPELIVYEGRVPLAVFPFTQTPIKPENLLVRALDARDVHFQITSPPLLGQVVLDIGDGTFVAVSVFSQWNVSNGKVFYEHTKSGKGQISLDTVRLVATSKFCDPLTNVSVPVEVSVRGAALGGLHRYVAVRPLQVKEGGQVSITSANVNFSAVTEFISLQHRGNVWRGGLPSLRLVVSEVPSHGWLLESDEHRLRPGAEILPSLLTTQSYLKYLHDDSETTEDQISFSLWLITTSPHFHQTTNLSSSSPFSPSAFSNSIEEDEKIGNGETSTWLLNITLPILVTPVNDQGFIVIPSKMPAAPIVQGHWRKLTRNDLQVTDPDTQTSDIVYRVIKTSHGHFLLIPEVTTANPVTGHPSSSTHLPPTKPAVNMNGVLSPADLELLKELPGTEKFTQADVDEGRVVLSHSGQLLPIQSMLEVSDGEHGPESLSLSIQVQPLTLQALHSQSAPIRIQQGNNIGHITTSNLPSATNGQPAKLQYNLTRHPLHGKVILKDKTASSTSSSLFFTHQQLLEGELSYVQTDMSVTNDSFEIQAEFGEPELRKVSSTWLVNVVSIPLLKRVKEVRSFVRGFAVGGIVAPDESEFAASFDMKTVLTLALLDASPLAALTGTNPLYEIISPPKYGALYKVPSPPKQQRYKRGPTSSASTTVKGRRTSRFSHEDVRRGVIIYVPELSNEIFPTRQSAQADEFIFKVLAPGVQPAIGIAKYYVYNGYFDPERGHTEIISDGSTDPATKRGGGGRLRDITYLVTPQLSRDSLIMIGMIIAGVMTLSLFLVLGIRCTCSRGRGRGGRRRNNRRNSSGAAANANNGGLNNGGGGDPNKVNGIGIIDAYAPSPSMMMDPCNTSDSEAGLRPLMMSTLSPRASSRNKVSMSGITGTIGSESGGSWTSSMIRNDTPTPSIPQCRVTPAASLLCSDSGGGGGGSGSTTTTTTTCPLISPTPICDTFTVLPEDLLEPPPEPYGFSYGNLPPPLDISDFHREQELLEEETAFLNFPHSSSNHHIINSNSSTMTRGTMTLPHPHSHSLAQYLTSPTTGMQMQNSQGTNTPTHHHHHHLTPSPMGSQLPTLGGTLNRRQQGQQQQPQGKNQYWV